MVGENNNTLENVAATTTASALVAAGASIINGITTMNGIVGVALFVTSTAYKEKKYKQSIAMSMLTVILSVSSGYTKINELKDEIDDLEKTISLLPEDLVSAFKNDDLTKKNISELSANFIEQAKTLANDNIIMEEAMNICESSPNTVKAKGFDCSDFDQAVLNYQ